MTQKVLLEDGSVMGYLATNSGTIHPTEAEALADENDARYQLTVGAFIASRSWNRGQDTRASSLIKEYLAWCDTRDGQEAIAQAAQPAQAPAPVPAAPVPAAPDAVVMEAAA